MTGTHVRTCPLCEATCGLELTLDEEGAVKVIRGDRHDVFSKGFVCPKGTTLHRLHTDPDRLRAPLVRRHGELVEASWEEAFAAVHEGLSAVFERHGRGAAAIYLGNPSAHGHGTTIFGRFLVKALGTRSIFSASTVDQMPKHVSSGLMFGNGLSIPVPDLDRTDHIVLLGANPYESNGSLCTAPDFPGRLEAVRARGGRVVVVDPRRTRTAEMADEHVAIRPGTDALLLLAMANVLFAEDLVDLGELADQVLGLDEVRDAVQPFTAAAVSTATTVPADTIVRLARDLAAAPSAAVYGRIGTHTVAFGTIAAWAVDVLNVLTGNLDRPGGAMWPSPAHTRARTAPGGRGYQLGRWQSRVGGHPEANGELPVAILAEEIETPGEGQVRALVTVAGNPVLSTPHSNRLDSALDVLEFMVSVDPYLNETTRHADVILPPPTQLERSQYDLAFYALSVRNVANWSPPLYEPTGPSEVEILSRLALIASGQGPDADPQVLADLAIDGLLGDAVGRADSPVNGRDPVELRGMVTGDSPADQVLDVMLRLGRHGDGFGATPDGLSLAKLAENPHGIDFGPLEPQLPNLLTTASGKVELAPAPIIADLPRLAATMESDPPEFLLVGRRHLRSNNSWMHNIEVLVKGRDRCTLQVHPDDATRLRIEDGTVVKVTSAVGEVQAVAELTDSVMEGVVSLPHGWGHGVEGTRMTVAARHAGVNSNVLTDGSVIDPLSGNAALNAIPVTIGPLP